MYPVSKHEAMKATFAYAEIFHSVLTKQELVRWFLFYPARTTSKSIALHNKNTEKWEIARRASRWLAIIPTIRLIGVTGGLAMNNAMPTDDIDLFFIVAGGTLWISRMMATVCMDMLGLRRHPSDTKVANKVCLNMFMTDHRMTLSSEECDCFAAHEVLQMEPLFIRGNTYKDFLHANRWVKYFLPNAWKWRIHGEYISDKHSSIFCFIFPLFEPLTKYIQLRYMKKHRTSEVISDTVLRFHPKDARVWIKRSFAKRLARFNIPLDKIFYAG